MFKTIVALFVCCAAAVGCRAASDGKTLLLGQYALTHLDGGPLPAPSPDQPGMLVVSLTLALTEERFELASTFRTTGDSLQTAPPLTGAWEVTEEELRFRPEQAEPGTTVVFTHRSEGPTLVLTDPKGHRWTMVRAAATGAGPLTPEPSIPYAEACRAPDSELFIDHVIFAVHALSEAVESYRARGFTIKPGRLHPDGLLNAHVKLRSVQEIELMSLVGAPASDIAEEYARILADGEGGAYLALGTSDLDRAARASTDAGLRPARPSSGSAAFVSFPTDSAAMAVFFGGRSGLIDADSFVTHANGASGIEQVWIEGEEALATFLEALGAVRCGEAQRGELRGQRLGFANGEVVLVARKPGARPRLLGGRLEGVATERAWFGTIESTVPR